MKNIGLYGKDQYGNTRQIRSDENGFLVPSYNFRDITVTASTTLIRGTETTAMAGQAGLYLDVTSVNISNSSTNAIKVVLRAATGGGIEETFRVGADNTALRQFNVPHPQSEQGATWTAQITGAGEVSDSPIDVDIHAVKHNRN